MIPYQKRDEYENGVYGKGSYVYLYVYFNEDMDKHYLLATCGGDRGVFGTDFPLVNMTDIVS